MFGAITRYSIQLTLVAASCTPLVSLAETDADHFFQQLETLQLSHATSTERIETLSAMFQGAPYVDGNLGEGSQGQYDRDPLYRFDVFDCTTYVETVLAGAISTSQQTFADNINKIRYQDGKVSFVTRNHFASADWLPNNQWLLQDITQQVEQRQTRTATTLIDKPAWYQAMTIERLQNLPQEVDQAERLNALHEEAQQVQARTVNTAYVPLTALFQGETINQALLDRIPSGSIISMVRPDYDVKKWIGTNLNITHQSIAIRHQGKLYLRHASQLHKIVMDEDFVEYFAKYKTSSTLKGFNIQQVNLN